MKVTPEETMKITGHTCSDTLEDVLDLYYKALRLCYEIYGDDRGFNLAVSLTALWNAGRVQGIREERAKRRREHCCM